MLDLKIVGGTIVDGSGAPRYRGDIGVKDGKITAVGKVDEDARQTIDATGKIVSPGFIDIHTHYDAQVFWDPTVSPSSYHGITTIFGGFCGFSIAPLNKDSAAYLMPMLARVEGMPLDSLKNGVPWDWHTFGEYLSRLDGKLAINAGFMAGHSTIRRYVMGPRAVGQPATREELDEMKKQLRKALSEGALGFSTTISPTHNDADGNPVPSRAATREELLEMFAVISEFEGTCAEMLPGVNFTQETYEILTDTSLAAQRPVNWNALGIITGTPEEAKDMEKKLGASDYAASRGATVVGLMVPQSTAVRLNLYSGFSYDAVEGWAPFFKLSVAERIEKLKDPAYRAMLRDHAKKVTGVLGPLVNFSRTEVCETYSLENKKYEGRIISDIAKEEGREDFDVFCAIAVADGLRTSFSPVFAEENSDIYKKRAAIYDDPRAIIGGSDAGAHVDMINLFTIPTSVLSLAVREHKVLSLERAVNYLTLKPAQLMGLRNRGKLAAGWCADIVVFDEKAVQPGKIHTRTDLPANGARLYADAEGIQNVVVNGKEIIRNGDYLGVAAGTVLRSGKDTYTVTIPAAEKRAVASA